MSESPPPVTLRLRLTATAERYVRSGHPWVYSDSVTEQNREGDIGNLAVIFDKKDKFLAMGLFDPTSPIRVRVLHAGKPVRVSTEWWRDRLVKAGQIRRAQFNDQTTGFRWISGESDGFPGLVLDRYADVLVLKLYSAIWLPMLPSLVDGILAEFGATALVLRLSRNIQEIARTRWGASEGCLHGHTENLVEFLENGIRFEAEVIQGQKTGFYLDQRDNRARVERLANRQDVLNVFSFSGGFSLYAARGGARSVTDLDISKHALESARRNFALNTWATQVPHHQVQGDAFEWLATGSRQLFDLIICDPPSLARREGDRAGAIRAYHTLATSCLKRLRPGGVLVAASCSAHVSTDEFLGAVFDAADRVSPHVELWRSGHAMDHPATFPEANYLKCLALRLSRA